MTDTIEKRLGTLFWVAVGWLAVISLLAIFAPLLPIKDPDAYYLVKGVRCLLYTSPSPRDATLSRMPSSA